MRLVFLGTAASEGFPNAFCACGNCQAARTLGGPSLRKRSAVLIDGELLIDLGPDLQAAAQQHGLALDGLRYCLQTHEHHDHLDPSHLLARSAYCGVRDAPHLHLYASEGALRRAAAGLNRRLPPEGLCDPTVAERLNLTAHVIAPFQTFAVGPYRVSSLQAAHDPEGLVAMLYLVERDGRTLLYATDTGPLPEATVQALADLGRRLDVVVMDHTFGFGGRSTGHLNAEQFREQVERLRGAGLLAEDVRLFAHHLGHHSHPPHPELAALTAAHGYAPAHDGLAVEV